MGRKNKSKKSSQGNGASTSSDSKKQLSAQVKTEVMQLVRQLLEQCSQPAGSGGSEFEKYLEIRDTVEKIRSIQKDICLDHVKRESRFTNFIDWLKSNNVDTSSVDIGNFEELGYGLKASTDLKEGEMFLAIPRDVMMTPQSASKSTLGGLIAQDQILQVMPSVALSLHLLCECRSEDSFWKPYIDILPSSYSTPLYFTADDIKQLKGSPAQGECINQYRNIGRQYGYFYKMFNSPNFPHSLPFKEFFTFDDYRWAVSTVMTRQNQIPTVDGGKMTFALIPLWDMCNHCNGLITTDFNLEKNCSECYSLRKYTKGDQIFIFYGARSNAELLVNNGFVYPENEHDRMAVKLGMSKSDPSMELKAEVLGRCGIQSSRTFYLHTGDLPVDSDLLLFLRIFQMDEVTLRERFGEANAAVIREELGNLDKIVSPEVETKVWNFLQTRATLLLKSYETTAQEDEELLHKGKLSDTVRLCVQLCLNEKNILKSVTEFSASRIQKLKPESEAT